MAQSDGLEKGNTRTVVTPKKTGAASAWEDTAKKMGKDRTKDDTAQQTQTLPVTQPVDWLSKLITSLSAPSTPGSNVWKPAPVKATSVSMNENIAATTNPWAPKVKTYYEPRDYQYPGEGIAGAPYIVPITTQYPGQGIAGVPYKIPTTKKVAAPAPTSTPTTSGSGSSYGSGYSKNYGRGWGGGGGGGGGGYSSGGYTPSAWAALVGWNINR